MKTISFVFAMLFSLSFFSLKAQINIEKKVKNQTTNKANKKVDQGIDKGLNAVEEGVKGIFKKKAPTESPEEKAPVPDQPDNKKGSDTQKAPPADPSLVTYSKYDFTPGEKVIFFEDFTQDKIGDFPALWNTNGSAEIVTTNLYPGNWLKFSGRESVWTDELLDLPENYTIEFDVIPIKGESDRMAGYTFRLMQSKNVKAFDPGSAPGQAAFTFTMEYFGRPGYHTHINSTEGQGLALRGYNEAAANKQKENGKYHIALWAQKARIRLYQNETKLFDLPKAFPVAGVKMDRIRFESGALMVSNIRIAVGAPDMRNKLITEGKLVTYGIYFDVNQDIVKPESYGTLKEIAGTLNEAPDVKVKIIGHTDADGQDAANLDLSKRRAAAVKNELVKSFGVNAERLMTDGAGEGQPVAPNDTPVNKALNRRVELIRL